MEYFQFPNGNLTDDIYGPKRQLARKWNDGLTCFIVLIRIKEGLNIYSLFYWIHEVQCTSFNL